MRRVMTVVLPVPAPAMISSGPGLVGDGRRLGRVQPLEDALGAPRPSAIRPNYTTPGTGLRHHQGEGIRDALEADGQRAEQLAVHLHEAAGVAVDHRAASLQYVTPGMPRWEPVKAAAR